MSAFFMKQTALRVIHLTFTPLPIHMQLGEPNLISLNVVTNWISYHWPSKKTTLKDADNSYTHFDNQYSHVTGAHNFISYCLILVKLISSSLLCYITSLKDADMIPFIHRPLVSYMGVILDENLTFFQHIRAISTTIDQFTVCTVLLLCTSAVRSKCHPCKTLVKRTSTHSAC